MRKHNKYDLVNPMFKLGELKEFRDIFKHLPKTAVAERLGREKGRFNQLIENPDGFILHELIQLGGEWDLLLSELGRLIEAQQPVLPQSDPSKTATYRAVGLLIKEGKRTRLEDLFGYKGISETAKELGRKSDTVKRYLKHVEKFQVKDLRTLASLYELSLVTMFKLVEAQYDEQMHKSK
jgi:hypothetical protein